METKNQFDLQQNVRLLFICIAVYQDYLTNRRKQQLGNGLSKKKKKNTLALSKKGHGAGQRKLIREVRANLQADAAFIVTGIGTAFVVPLKSFIQTYIANVTVE